MQIVVRLIDHQDLELDCIYYHLVLLDVNDVDDVVNSGNRPFCTR